MALHTFPAARASRKDPLCARLSRPSQPQTMCCIATPQPVSLCAAAAAGATLARFAAGLRRTRQNWAGLLGLWLSGCALAGLAQAAEVVVAVAANFTVPMGKIAAQFEQDTGHTVQLAFGSTGRFYAQIKNGAPFHVLLAADDETPAKLAQEGLGVPTSRFTYAIGRLVLWSPQPGLVDEQGAVLTTERFSKLALADPRLAPYGRAALETLGQLGLLDKLRPKLVQGENIAQTYQFIQTQNAALGFVALSQVFAQGRWAAGSHWLVPSTLHEPIRQDALLLQKGQGQAAAQALLHYLRGDKARAIIRDHGYAW